MVRVLRQVRVLVCEKNQQRSCAATVADGGTSAPHDLPLSQICRTNLTIPAVDQNGRRSSIPPPHPHIYGCCRSDPATQLAKNPLGNSHRPWQLSYRHHIVRRSAAANTHAVIASGKNPSSPPPGKTHCSSHWRPDQAQEHGDINDGSVQAMDLKFNDSRGKRCPNGIRISDVAEMETSPIPGRSSYPHLVSDLAGHELEDVAETHLVEFANRSMIHINPTQPPRLDSNPGL
ncbi:hypothetical protein ACLOJK_030750 [Asimina triloba]